MNCVLCELYLKLLTKMPVERWGKNMNKAITEEIQMASTHTEVAHSLLLIIKKNCKLKQFINFLLFFRFTKKDIICGKVSYKNIALELELSY